MNVPWDSNLFLGSCQLVLDVVLIVSILLFHRRLKILDGKRLGALLRVLKDAENVCAGLDANLREKDRLVGELNRTLNSLENVASCNLPEPCEAEDQQGVRARVLLLFQRGKGVSEIARLVGLTQGEVELIISLANTATDGKP